MRHCGAGEDIAHYEGEVGADPEECGEEVAADGMDVEIVAVDFEVDPVEGVGLD